MARVGGRNAFIAWVAGAGCLATLGVLAYLALPLLPASVAWLGGADGRSETSRPVAADETAAPGTLTECRDLYDSSLWAELRAAADAVMTPSADAPVTTATALVAAIQPQVTFTCGWHSEVGTISMTLATVPVDAGAIASSALPGAGFTCEAVGERTRCTRTDGDLTETIEAGGGRWLSSSETSWHIDRLAARMAEVVWP